MSLQGGRERQVVGVPPEMTWAVIDGARDEGRVALELEARAVRRVAAVGEEGLLDRRAVPGGVISTLKVLPASSQSLLTSVTVTLASASMRELAVGRAVRALEAGRRSRR